MATRATVAVLLLLLASSLALAAASPRSWSSGGALTSPLARHRAAALARAAAKLSGSSSGRNSNSSAAQPCAYVSAPPNLQFPRDLSAHVAMQNEYWWILGNMQTKSGRQFGVTILTFRTDVTAQCTTLADQLVETAWAISDPATGNFHRRSSLEVGFQLKMSDVSNGGPFQLLSSTYGASQTSATGFEVHARGVDQGRYTLGLEVGWTFQGQLNTSLPDNGFAPVGFDGFVPTHDGPIGAGNLCLNTLTGAGTVHLGNASYDVTGDFWIDHSFWTDPPVTNPGDGWEWLAFQLPNGWRGAFTHLHNRDRTISEYSFANVFRVGATPYGVALRPSEFDIVLREPWISPITNITYYTQATVTVPSMSLVVEWRTLQRDNENLKHDLQTPFEYEGAARVHATIGGAAVAGTGWMETLRASQGP